MFDGNTREVALPPDQSLRISTLKSRLIILSVSNQGLLLGRGTAYEDFSGGDFGSGVYIFAESLGFTSSVHSPNGLTISAASIISPTASSLSSAGAPGKTQSSTPVPAESGQSAGPLNFYLQSGTDENAQHLAYVACGGNGGDTIFADSVGGNGGDGGKIGRIFQSYYSTPFKSFTTFLARDDVVNGSPDRLVLPTDAVYAAASDLSARSFSSDMSASVLSAVKTFNTTLETIHKGGTYTLRQLAVDARRVRNELVYATNTQGEQSFLASGNCAGGYPGAGQGVRGKTGEFGKRGTDYHLLLPQHDELFNPIDDPASLRQAPFAFVHPEQCAMLLTRAKTYYYMGSAILRAEAVELFNRIIDRLSFLPLKESDQLYKAYAVSNIMPANALITLQSIKTDATTQLTHLISGLDYNGYAATFAPRVSYQVYQNALDLAIADLEVFENAYIAYSAALNKQEELQDTISGALRQTGAMVSRLGADIEDLTSMLQAADRQIQLLTQPVIDAHRALLDAYEALKDRISSHFGLSVPQLVNAMTMMAFSPTKFMAAVQASDIIYQGFNSIPNIDGVSVNKSVIIGQLSQGEASVKGIKDTLSTDKLDGTFQLDDPYGTRLLTTENELMSFLSDYANSSFTDVVDEIKSKFDGYISAVLARNQQVLEYNLVLKLLVQKAADMKDYTDKANKLKGQVIKANDPDLPDITAYVDSIYQSSRARVMKYLNLVVRSLNFCMLQENDVYKIGFAMDTDTDDVPLAVTSTVLRSARSRIEERYIEDMESLGVAPTWFPPNFDDPYGKRVALKSWEWNALISDPKNSEVDVVIPTVFKETLPKNDFSGSYNVRVYRIRFGFTGLKLNGLSTSARVSVKLRHSGADSFVDKLNAEHRYTHDPITVNYSYILNSDGTSKVQENGNIATDPTNRVMDYAAPGLFTTWTVSLENSDISRLDFSQVKGAYLDFCGVDYAMP